MPRTSWALGPPSTSSSCAGPWWRPGTIGVVCYLTKFQLSRGFFFLLFIFGVPAAAARPPRAAPGHPRAAPPRPPQPGRHRRLPRPVDEVAAVLRRESWLGYTSSARSCRPRSSAEETPAASRSWAPPHAPPPPSPTPSADVVLFAGGALASAQQMRRAIWDLEDSLRPGHRRPERSPTSSSERLKVRPVGRPAADAPRGPARGARLPLGQAHLRLRRLASVLIAAVRPAAARAPRSPSSCTTADRCSSARPASAATVDRSAA